MILRLIISLGVFITFINFAKAQDVTPGFYEVDVKVRMPHIQEPVIQQKIKYCLSNKSIKSKQAFKILSNNPLQKCKRLPVIKNNNQIEFRIQCEGRDGAFAIAKFHITEKSFTGIIDMNMGGKNMRLIEHQSAHLLSKCPGT